MKLPILKFTHGGRERTLAKHPRVQQQLRRGEVSPADARLTPWFLRVKLPGMAKEQSFKLDAADKKAIAGARDILNGHAQQPKHFSAWLEEREARRGVTLGALASAWFTAGCPFDGEAARTPAAAAQLQNTVTRALNYWQDRRPVAITHNTMSEFVAWRRQNVRVGGEGSRSADLELAALSCLCQWAVLTERLVKNPFAERKRFQRKEAVSHCHEAMPNDDEELHRVLALLFNARILPTKQEPDRVPRADTDQIIAGAYLAFTALSGLRPGEPEFLGRRPALREFPRDLARVRPGEIYPMPDGKLRMAVHRLKHGQNPAVEVHPALADFLEHWHAWLNTHYPLRLDAGAPSKLFPITQESVAGRLERACKALNLPLLKPHGFGRAYYVRVCRSQGDDDAVIAVKLGHSSNGKLIRSTYGDPRDPVGGKLHDWLPSAPDASATVPAWAVLKTELPANLLHVQFGSVAS